MDVRKEIVVKEHVEEAANDNDGDDILAEIDNYVDSNEDIAHATEEREEEDLGDGDITSDDDEEQPRIRRKIF